MTHTIEALLRHALSVSKRKLLICCKRPCLSGLPVRTIRCALFVRWGGIREGISRLDAVLQEAARHGHLQRLGRQLQVDQHLV